MAVCKALSTSLLPTTAVFDTVAALSSYGSVLDKAVSHASVPRLRAALSRAVQVVSDLGSDVHRAVESVLPSGRVTFRDQYGNPQFSPLIELPPHGVKTEFLSIAVFRVVSNFAAPSGISRPDPGGMSLLWVAQAYNEGTAFPPSRLAQLGLTHLKPSGKPTAPTGAGAAAIAPRDPCTFCKLARDNGFRGFKDPDLYHWASFNRCVNQADVYPWLKEKGLFPQPKPPGKVKGKGGKGAARDGASATPAASGSDNRPSAHAGGSGTAAATAQPPAASA